VGVLNQFIGEKQWHRFESRLERNVNSVCNLLREFKIKATFFALGWIGDMYPDIIRKIVSEGHEIASGGYWKRSAKEMSPSEFRDDLQRAKRALENAGSNKIIGYRCPHKRLDIPDLWVLDILAEEGYLYDASFYPIFKSDKGKPLFLSTCEYQTEHSTIWEIPMSTKRILGYNIPISGGNYFRQIPHWFMMRKFKEWCKKTEAPFVLYFHTWELDPEQPRVTPLGLLSRVRQYRNLDKMKSILPIYFRQGQFQSISQYLNLPLEYPSAGDTCPPQVSVSLERARGFKSETPDRISSQKVSVIIPCFNEASSLPYLKKVLQELVERAQNKYELNFIFVDDASRDDTYKSLQQLFGRENACKILRHNKNEGITGALLTGLRSADTEIVCSIDADCSYDPLILLEMIPLLEDGVDLVTASPYHNNGEVQNVPGWRLLISKSLSRIYQSILTNKLATYTSFLRVYRRSSILKLVINYKDFLGVTEMIAKLDSSGGTILEYPAILQCRIFGYSKMKVFSTIIGHLKLLAEIVRYRHKGAFSVQRSAISSQQSAVSGQLSAVSGQQSARMNILVTGGSGFIGTNLVSDLLKKGHRVLIYDKQISNDYPDLCILGDIRDKENLANSMQGVDVVYHLAAEHRDDVRPASTYYQVNVGGAKNIVYALEKNHINRLIFTSTVAVYDLNSVEPDEDSPIKPFNDYGRSKYQAEVIFNDWADANKTNSLVIVRPTVIFGERNRGNVYNLFYQLASGRFIMVGNGKNKKSIGYILNFTKFLTLLLQAASGKYIYNYADKPDLRIDELIRIAQETLNIKPEINFRIPYSIGILGGYAFDCLTKINGKTYPISSIRIKKFCADTRISTEKLRNTGFTAPFSLIDGLKKMIISEFTQNIEGNRN